MLIILVLTIPAAFAFGQNPKPIFVGIMPGFSTESFYPEEAFDVNILPFIVQAPLGKRLDIRVGSELNYHVGEMQQISNFGAQVVLPFFFNPKDEVNIPSDGIYLGPVVGIGRSNAFDHNSLTLALEPGFMFKSENRFSISIGVQIGATHFNFDQQPNEWGSHIGVKFAMGFWLGGGRPQMTD